MQKPDETRLVSEQSGLSYARAKDFRLWPLADTEMVSRNVCLGGKRKVDVPVCFDPQLTFGSTIY